MPVYRPTTQDRKARHRRPAVVIAIVAVLSMLFGVPSYAVGGKVPSVRLWQPGGVQSTPSVPGHAAAKPGLTPSQRTAVAKAAQPYRPPAITWPAGTATTTITGPNGDATPPTKAGALPVMVASADTTAGAARAVRVSVSQKDTAAKAGVDGVLFAVSRADGGAAASPVTVSLDYTGFAGAYGGGWADRLRLVQLPGCAIATPQLAGCRAQKPVPFHKNLATGTLTAQVAATTNTVLAATASASGSVGTYTATSLAPAAQWSAGNDSGDFTYTYPIEVPKPATGAAPQVALSYDSGSVDGRTSATNAQSSWIGDGWDYAPGYIERSYQPCSTDGITNSADNCWAGNLVQMVLNGQSAALVRDDTSGTWRSKDDDGTQVIALHGANNGAWQGEAWEIVEPDGTQYYFGQNHLPGGTGSDPATNSAWTEPVYCPKANDGPPNLSSCNSASSGTNSFTATMAYRWNLDYVVDPHGNLQTFTWQTETNYYQRGAAQANGTGTNTSYVRGGYLSSISYGYRLSDAITGTKPVDVVNFGVGERCLTTSTFTDCGGGNLTSTTAPNWPDVPFDQMCATQSGTCSNYGPTFFTTKRLTSISTTVLVNGTPQPVDSYTLSQMFPAPQAGVVSTSSGVSATHQGDGTVAVMWLNSIQRNGTDTGGSGTSAQLPATTFTAMETANRVDGATTGAAALYRPRMDYLTTETGSQIVVSYADPQCSRVNNTMPASPDNDTMNCYAQYWTPTDGTGSILDWFVKPQVTTVTVNDLVAPAAWSQAQVTSYAYQGIAWHRDDSPLTPAAQRTWDQFRGYRTVTVTKGVASVQAVPTQTVTTYLQGMDGDHSAGGATRSVSVTDSVGDTVTDSDWLQGKELETQTLLGVGGAAQQKTVNGPWAYRSTATEAQASGMPALVARMATTAQTRTYALFHDGSWKKTETDTAYDTSGRVVTSDAKGDGTAAVPEVCTTTSYAQDSGRNMLAFPDHVTAVQGACGTTATAANTVSDTRTYYDSATALGTITGPGDLTRTEALDSYDGSGNPVYVTEGKSTYDAYGRITSAIDADGHTGTTAYSTPGATPDQVTATNPMGWTIVTTLDPARALPISSTDVNGELTTETYDGLGRLTAVWTPLHAQSANAPADQKFTYAVGGAGAPTTVSTAALRDDGSYATDVKIYDGAYRLIQEQSPTADASPGRLITDTHYNSLGQTTKTTTAYYDSTTSPNGTVFVAANDSAIPSESEPAYDGMGRLVTALAVAKGVNQWSATTAYHGTDETDSTPPTGGTATSTFTDALGRTIASWKYNTPTPTGKASDATITAYTYTPAGKTSTITDATGNQWHYTYDAHQRQIQITDPGAGTSHTTYSPGGAVLTATDGRGKQLTYAYDSLGRKTAEYDTTNGAATSPADQQAAWTYDGLAKGQPTASIRYTNGATDADHTYTEAVTGYTVLYQPTGSSVTIPAAEGALAGTYQTSGSYSTTTSLLIGTHYNAEAGLPKEQDNYSYTLSGLLSAFGGTFTYLNDVSYTPQGQVLQTNFGPYGTQFVRTETYDQPTQRLLTVADATQTSTTGPVNDTSYTYTPSGTITSLSTVDNGGAATDRQCFGYDAQNRLTGAWTDSGGVNSPTTGQVMGIGGCVDSTPVAGKVTGGPAPYWESFGYNALGDRVTETDHQNNVTQTLAYPSTGNQPDAVQSVAVQTASGTTTTSYQYDPAGNVTARANQQIGYDAEGHTGTVTNTTTNTTTSYTYNADGTLLVQRDPATKQTVVYLPYGEELHLNTATGAVSGLRYYARSPDGVTVVRSSAGTVAYELADKLGTATTTVDAGTLAITRRYMDPYGATRGPAAANWPDQHGYLSQPTDPTTGLDLLGARNYDPTIGRFLSVDPLLETGDNNQMNGYAYAADDPVNGSDPTGQSRIPDGGDCWTSCGGAPSSGNTDQGTSSSDQCWGPGGEWMCGGSGSGAGGPGSCGNGVYADGCAPGTANGDPNGPDPSQQWIDKAQASYADSCTNNACIQNANRHANDAAYWRRLAEIAAEQAAIANNIAVAQEEQAEAQAAALARANACSGWRCFLKHAAQIAAGVSTWASYASFIPVIGEYATALSVTAGALSSGLYLAEGDYQDAGTEALGTVLSVAAGGFGKLPGESTVANAWEGASSHIGGIPMVQQVGGDVVRTGLETGRKAIVTPTYTVIKWDTSGPGAKAISAYATAYGDHSNFDPMWGNLSYSFN